MRRFQALAVVVVSAVAATACGRAPSPPYARAFAMHGQAPRLLESHQEITVPISVVNTGQVAWDPARVHVSYHWVWFIPRELASRSRWNAPYHDGIRSDLPAAVPPGGRVALEGRILAPSWPGLYWLQWDMVEEGVIWFGQVSPHHPRTLVLVVPSIAVVFAPVPLLIAIAGIVLVRLKPDATDAGLVPIRSTPLDTGGHINHSFVASGTSTLLGAALSLSKGGFSRTDTSATYATAFALSADISWCIACLVAKPLILVREALLEPTAVAYWLIVVAAVVPPVLVTLFCPRRLRSLTLLIVGIFASLLILADVVYYRFFGDVLSAPALLAAGQTRRVWGSVRSLLTPQLAWLVVDWPFAAWLAIRLARIGSPAVPLRRRAARAAAVLGLLAVPGLAMSAPRVLAAARLDQMFRDRAVVEQLGPFGFHVYDAWNYARATWLRPPATDAEVRRALDWFAARARLRSPSGDTAGAARGKNVIVVQVESLQELAVDFRVDGQEVMPTLRRWANDGARFTNVTDQTNEGRTSDAEFTMLASLLPLDHGAVAFRYPGNHLVALPRVLAEHGYHTLSAVPFEPGFWNRRVMHPAYGFQQSLFEPDFQLTEQIGWGLNDRDFLQQMVPRLAQMPRPFLAWLITLSLHHPFADFPAAHKVLKLGALEGTAFGNYLHTMRFFDAALAEFIAALDRHRLLDDSVVVVFGDHDAGFARDSSLAAAIGIGAASEDAADAAWAANDRVPLFISGAGVRGIRATAAGQTDFAPTLLALLGIDAAPLPYVGRNLLGDAADAPLLRPYGGWLDGRHLFLARGGAHLCYDVARKLVDARESCLAADEAARRDREVSRLVIAGDLQQRLRDELAARIVQR